MQVISKKIIFLVLFLIVPNTAYAYVDPQIFALIWQSIVAFIFAFITYSRFILLKSSNYIKNIFYYAKKLKINFIANYFFIFLLLIIPILQITSKNRIYFSFSNYLHSFLIMLTIFLIIFVLIYLVLHLLKLNKNYTIYLAITTILISYFMNSFEGYIISNYLSYPGGVIYLRIISLITFPIIICSIIFFLVKKKIQNIKVFLFSFIFCLTVISIMNFSKDIQPHAYQAKDNWKFEKANYKKVKIEDNIFFIVVDAYMSPKYYNILYPNQKNILFDTLNKKNFYLKENSFSSYPATLLSLASIFNSNYLNTLNSDDYRKNIRNLDNGLDNSFLINALKKNNYNQNIISCHFKYQTRKKYCKDHLSYTSLLGDLSIVEAIYFYNSFNSVFRHSKKKIRSVFINLFLNNKSTLDENNNKNDTILKFLDKKIKVIKKTKNNYFNIVLKVPHAPFVVNSNCSWKNIPDYEDTVNITLIKDEETRVKGYIDNVNCVNSHLIKLISLIERYDDEAIIILLGDNGAHLKPFKHIKNLKLIKSPNMKLLRKYDRNGVLLSVGGGSKCLKNNEIKKINHPNLFRIILNCGDKKINSLINYQVEVEGVFVQ